MADSKYELYESLTTKNTSLLECVGSLEKKADEVIDCSRKKSLKKNIFVVVAVAVIIGVAVVALFIINSQKAVKIEKNIVGTIFTDFDDAAVGDENDLFDIYYFNSSNGGLVGRRLTLDARKEYKKVIEDSTFNYNITYSGGKFILSLTFDYGLDEEYFVNVDSDNTIESLVLKSFSWNGKDFHDDTGVALIPITAKREKELMSLIK